MPASPEGTPGGATYEQLWEAVFEASLTSMLVVSLSRRIWRANKAAANLTGYSTQQLETLSLEALSVARMRQEYIDFWDRHVADGAKAVCGTRPLLLASGSTVPIRFSVKRVGEDRVLAVYVPSPEAGDEIVVSTDTPHPDPTPRQREIVTQLALGLTDEQMAQRLMISPDTVRTHIRNALRQTGSYNRPHLVARAMQRGWIVQTE
jgi:PAS domain S-box-containing protein